MPYEPLVLLRRLAPEDVNKLIRQNPLPINPSQNAQTNDNQSQEKNVMSNSSILSTENQTQFSRSLPKLRIPPTNLNNSNCDSKFVDELQQGTPLKKRNHGISLKNHNGIKFTDKSNVASKDIFNKDLFVVIENGINEVIRDMVNSTAQHPKLRKRTNSTVNNRNTSSNNSATSTRDPTIVKERADESIMITTTKTPLSTVTPVIEVINKKTKDIVSSNQHHKTSDELSKQANCNKTRRDSHDFFGINLRTRTISTTIPPLNHSVSTTVQPNRPKSRRGRPPRQKNINSEANAPKPPVPTSLERFQRKRSVNQCNGNSDKQQNQNKNVNVIKVDTDSKNALLSGIEKNEDCVIVDVVCKKKINSRKRKQSDTVEVVAKKRVCNNRKNSLVKKKDLTEKSLPNKPALVVDTVNYGFLSGYDFIKPYRQHTGSNPFPSSSYGRTNWPISWEYSASSLTGHIQKKVSKDILRKIRLFCSNGTSTKSLNPVLPPKKKSMLKKNQHSVAQIRDSSSKLTKLVSVAKRQKPGRPPGRPPGRKNKLLQLVKSSCPRKSPRQHASTLAAIMSTKTSNSDKLVNQPDNLLDFDVDCNINSLDNEGPCILTMAVPNLEHNMPLERHDRHRRQLDDQPGIIKRRRRRRRSITPSPPKLCAQIPLTQRTPVNTIDHEVVKLRTKHVDVVKRRVRDERLRTAFVYQQLQRVQEIAEENRCDLARNVLPYISEKEHGYQFTCSSVLLQTSSSQDQVWSSQIDNDSDLEEPNNMSLQIMYEQTGDKRFLCTDLSKETLRIFYQQRELALAERLTNNNNGENSDLGIDMINASNKRKKKRPNMTGWPKEKRRKIISSNNLNGDSDVERNKILLKRRKAAEKQKHRRQRLKLEQQRLPKNKLKIKESTKVIPKRGPGRPRGSGPKKKIKTEAIVQHQRSPSVSSNSTISSTISSKCNIKEKKLKNPRQKRMLVESKKVTEVTATDEPNRIVKRSCGRPKGSGWRQRLKLKMLNRRNQTSLTSVQQKENVQEQISSGKLKCVISTRNNRMKLLSTSGSSCPTATSQKKTIGNKSKKSTDTFNVSSSCLVPLPVTEGIGKTTRTTVKRKRLVGSWEVGRPKRYTSNHGRNSSCVEEDCCFVGSQPFEQHCPGVGGLSHNTVLENQHDHQKENSNTVGSL